MTTTDTASESTDFPPPGFVQTDSAVPGIEVWMPAPPEPEAREPVVDFDCPQCGSTTAFSATDGGVTCDHCGYFEAPQAEVVGQAAESFEFTAETVARAAQGWGTDRQELACGSCGASTVLDADTLTHTCPFCGSNQVVQREAPQDVLRPRFIVPFKIDAAACREMVTDWLGASWKAPSDLRQRARVDDLAGVYLPMWTFGAKAWADWKAQVGHQESRSIYIDGEWETQWVTKWKWESGYITRDFENWLVPGTTQLGHAEFDQIGSFDLSALVAYDASYLAGMRAQAYDVQLEDAWAQARGEMREVTRETCRDGASTDKIRNFSMTLNFEDETWRYLLLPFFVIAYQYAGEPFRVVVNGQTGELTGRRPVDSRKQLMAVLAAAAPGLALTLVGLGLNYTRSDSLPLLLGVGALGIGLVIGITVAYAGDD